jgi:sialic acid synthase SpsE
MINMAKIYDLPLSAYIKIKKYCNKPKILYLSSCFDDASINFYVKKLKTRIVKIDSNKIIDFIRQKTKNNPKYRFVKSLGCKRYNQLIRKSEFLIRNSSSGIYEALYQKISIINLGERQKVG